MRLLRRLIQILALAELSKLLAAERCRVSCITVRSTHNARNSTAHGGMLTQQILLHYGRHGNARESVSAMQGDEAIPNSPAPVRRSAMGRAIGSLMIVVPLTVTGVFAVWAGFFLRTQPFFSVPPAEDEAIYWFFMPFIPRVAACFSCSVLWLAGSVCILLGLGLLGDFWNVGGPHLLGVWSLWHGGALGLAMVFVSAVHPHPAVFWHEIRSVLISPLNHLSLAWRLYFVLLCCVFLGSFLLVLARKPLTKPT